MNENIIELLDVVAQGFQDLLPNVVFVGGAVSSLYADKDAEPEIRITRDIDCIVKATTKHGFSKLGNNLRKLGFANDSSEGAPICRWIYKNILVDIMPTELNILGFTNRWYAEGIDNKISFLLPSGTHCFILSVHYYLGTKFEALNNRKSDLRYNADFTDICNVLANRNIIVEEISKSEPRIKKYLSEECKKLLNNPDLKEAIECVLPLEAAVKEIESVYAKIENISYIP